MDRYTELYAWMWKSFGEEEFTIDRFRMVFPTSQAPKVIHDLARKGYIHRIGRGTYRLTEPGDFIRNISEREPDDRMLDESEKDYAFCESTAVAIWTDGYYWTGFTKGFRPVHVAVRRVDLEGWRAFFKKKRAKFVVEGEKSGMNLSNTLKFCGLKDERMQMQGGEISKEGKPHDALEDCKLEGECFYRLIHGKNLFPEFSKFPVPEVLRK